MPTRETIEAAFAALGEQRRLGAVNMRLGGFIEALERLDGDAYVITQAGCTVDDFDSYRGFYEDLALEPSIDGGPCNVRSLVLKAKAAAGSTFTGYKGGDFVMDLDTPIWLSPHGQASEIGLVAVEKTGFYVLLRGELLDG